MLFIRYLNYTSQKFYYLIECNVNIAVVQMSEKRPRSDIVGTVRPARPDELRVIEWAALSRYDLLLAAIPLVMLAATIAGHVAAIPLWAALSIGGLVVLPILVDGLALHPPT